MSVTLYYYGEGPAVSNLPEGRSDFTHGVGETVGTEDDSSRCVFFMRAMLKLGAVNSEDLSASSRKLWYLSLTQGKKCMLNINYKSMRTFGGRGNNHMSTQRERNSGDRL